MTLFALLTNRYTWIAMAFLVYSGFLIEQTHRIDKALYAAAVEQANKRVRAVNDAETAKRDEEEAKRTEAVIAAGPVLAKAQKCIVTRDVAAALNGIR